MSFTSVTYLVDLDLRKSQSPLSVMRFKNGELVQVLSSLYSRYIKQEVITDDKTTSKL